MAVEERDKAHLADMLAAARDARMLAGDLSYDALMADVRTRLALERVPWMGIIGTRNALAHQYGAIDYRRLHATSRDAVPRLIETLERLLRKQG